MYRKNDSGLQIVEIEVTNSCNLNCAHCYVKKNKLQNMNSKDVASIIDQCADLGVNRLVFTGGEPLLYRKIFELGNYAKKLGIPEVVLFTNGLLIDEKNIDKLKIFNFVQLSIDAPPKRKPQLRIDYTEQINAKIDLLKSKKINVLLLATLHKSLIPFIDELIKYADSKKIKIAFNKLAQTNDSLKDEILSQEELKSALEKISGYRKKGYAVGCSDPFLFLVEKERMDFYNSLKKDGIKGGCTAGLAALYISVTGEVYPCPFISMSCGSVFKNTLVDIWINSSILNRLRNRKSYAGRCKTCKHINYCGGCRAASLYITGDLFGSDPNCLLDFVNGQNMISYDIFADFYDSTIGKDHNKFVKYVKKIINSKKNIKSILEVACGTGNVICAFSAKYDRYGIDISKNMLKHAQKKSKQIKFKLADMTTFKLNKKFDFAFCVFDSINHLLTKNKWKQTFCRVYEHLNETGLFLFDINTIRKLKLASKNKIQVYPISHGYVTINVKSLPHDMARWHIKIFKKIGKKQSLILEETINEKSFKISEIKKMLRDKFKILKMTFDFKRTKAVNNTSRRVFFLCQKKSQTKRAAANFR